MFVSVVAVLSIYDATSLLQLPPPEALHLNAPRKQDDVRPAGSEGHGPERRRSNSAIGMCDSFSIGGLFLRLLRCFLRVSSSWSQMFDALKVRLCVAHSEHFIHFLF